MYNITREKRTVYFNCLRAKKLGLPATLTLEEWLETLDYFNGMCAYCLHSPYEALDHFIPLKPGSSPLITIYKGTSKDNCVPACKVCNVHKWGDSPEYVLKFYYRREYSLSIPRAPFLSEEVINRICEYLGISLN